MYISLDDEHEKKLRKIAERDFGGSKGAIRDALEAAIDRLDQALRDESERQKRIKKFRALMDKGFTGFSMNLKGKKLWENRGELYDR
jgi:hypothetical protein